MIGEYFHTEPELQVLSQSIGCPNPGNLLLHGSVKAAKNTPSPHVTWNFAKYLLPSVSNVLWVTLRKNHLTRPFIVFSLEKEDLELGGLDLTDVFQELHVKFLDHFCDQVWIYGIKELTDMYKEWSYKHKRDGRLDARDTNFYYMVPDVIQELKRTELHLHPDFYFDEVNFEKDLDLITKSWHLSMPQESEQFKNGDVPFKWVEAWNVDVLKALQKSKMWQKWQKKNGEAVIFTALWNHC